MKIIITLIVTYSFIINSAYSAYNHTTSLIIKSFVKEYSTKLESNIQKYNENRKEPSLLIQTLNKKDKIEFLNILKYHKKEVLPIIKKKKGNYSVQIDSYKIAFNLVDAFNKRIIINGKVYSFSNLGIAVEAKLLEVFLKNNFVESSFIQNFIINEANAAIFTITASIMAIIALSIIINNASEDLELARELNRMKNDIEDLKLQCEQDIKLVGKPNEVKETLSILNILSEGNKLQKDILENHFYQKLASQNKIFSRIKESDPVNCESFVQLLKDKTYSDKDYEKERTGVIDDISIKLCKAHSTLQKCLIDFHEEFVSKNGNRSIEKLIENYTPKNSLLIKSLGK